MESRRKPRRGWKGCKCPVVALSGDGVRGSPPSAGSVKGGGALDFRALEVVALGLTVVEEGFRAACGLACGEAWRAGCAVSRLSAKPDVNWNDAAETGAVAEGSEGGMIRLPEAGTISIRVILMVGGRRKRGIAWSVA